MSNIKMTLKKYDVVYIGSKVDSIDDEPQSFNSKINAILVRTCVYLRLLVMFFVIHIFPQFTKLEQILFALNALLFTR